MSEGPTTRPFSLLRSSGVIGAATFLSRILGLVRDSLINACLDKATADAFLVAFRIPSLMRELFAEGALSAAFVPTLAAVRRRDGDAEANRLATAVLRLLAVVVTATVVLGILLAPWIARAFLIGRQDAADAESTALAAGLLRVMFPYLLAISLAALTMGLLNALLRFALPALSPALLNICMIAAIGLAWWRGGADDPVRIAYWLAGGVVVGGCLQFLSQYIQVRRMGYLKPLAGPLWHAQTPHMLGLMGPRAAAAAVTQLTIIINTVLASFLATGSILILWDAVRLFQFPLGVFGIAITTAAFPKLSIDATDTDSAQYERTLRSGLRGVTTVMVPSTIGLIVLAGYAVDAIYNHGRFHQAGLLGATQWALVCYTLGLVGHAGSKYLAGAFFALHDTRTPLVASCLTLVVHTAASVALMAPLGVAGLALGTSVAGWFQFILLAGWLRRRRAVSYGPLVAHGVRTLAAGLLMGAAVWGTLALFPAPGAGFANAVLATAAGGAVGTVCFVAAVAALLPEELQRFRRLRRR